MRRERQRTTRTHLGMALICLVFLCSTAVARTPEPEVLIQAESEIPEEQLLDVGIQIFDPGLPEDDEDALEDKGVFADLRKSEAKFIPFELKTTLEAAGQWGAVRVIPGGMEGIDVIVSGEILKSTGHDLDLRVRITDSTGKLWRKRLYRIDADPMAYKDDQIEVVDPYEEMYIRICNDMLQARERLKTRQLKNIRQVSRLRFGAQLAPDVYGDYLKVTKKGRYRVQKLPAQDDPMIARIARIRERDYMFVDTLNEYYADFYSRMDEPYDDWRVYSFEEEEALREIRRKARMRKALGALLIFAGFVAEGAGSGVARDAAIIGGAVTIKSGIDKGKEGKIHVEAIKELAASFDAEIAPLLIEVEGQTLRLEGSAETQFAEWRRLLRALFTAESGLPADPNADTAPSADPATTSAGPSQ